MSKLKTACPKPDKAPARPRRFGSSLPVGEKKPRKARKALKSSGRIKAKPRTPSEFARIYGSRARVRWVKAQECVGSVRGSHHPGPCENHHIENGGTSRKADFNKIIPLCAQCHDNWHNWGRATFEAYWGIDADALAAATESRWQSPVAVHPERK